MKRLILLSCRTIILSAFIFYVISNLFDNRIIDKITNILKASYIFRQLSLTGFMIFITLEINFRNSIKESSKSENCFVNLKSWIKDLITFFKTSDSMTSKIISLSNRVSIAIFKPNLVIILFIIIFCNFMLNNFTYVFSQTDIYSSSNYQKAANQFKSGQYDEAALGFSRITQFEDSNEYLTKIYNMNLNDFEKTNNGKVLLGSYDMDNDESNENQRILWDILEVNNGRMVLASHYVIDFKSFGNLDGTESWKDSYLRKWLNEEFYSKAFNSKEKECIFKTEIESLARQNKVNTLDYVYVLNVWEAQKYFKSDAMRKCKVQFFDALNVESFINGTSTWLRDSNELFRFSYIDPYGEAISSGDIQTKQYGVRPVINISIK